MERSVSCGILGGGLFARKPTLKSRMCPDFYTVLLCETDRLEHQRRVASVEAACDIGVVNELDELFVRSLLSIPSSVAAEGSAEHNVRGPG